MTDLDTQASLEASLDNIILRVRRLSIAQMIGDEFMEDFEYEKCEFNQSNPNEVYLEGSDEPVDFEALAETHEVYDLNEYLAGYPLGIVAEVGRLFTIVLSTGGPHIEITQDGGIGSPTITGYWGGVKVERTHRALSFLLDHYFGEFF